MSILFQSQAKLFKICHKTSRSFSIHSYMFLKTKGTDTKSRRGFNNQNI